MRLLLPFVALWFLVGCEARQTDVGWQALFDGKTLSGWSAPDMSYFHVEGGAITGETTKEHNPPRNQFIVWQGGEVADFELTFEFRIFGVASNSGMQLRSQVKEFGLVHGYQADMDGKAKFVGGIWDEYGTRKSLSARGLHTVIAADGSRTVTALPEAAVLNELKLDQWTRYDITAIGPRIELRLNGILATVLEDHETGKAAASGVLAMPIIPGEPMKVQYRDLRLKRR
ncbi:MAG TPA: DUF1080 domain-containing protein [Planctomycetota bacterium]|nr:DUF1080 domain-containing protein [Planctomycetota bacterium]